jgi:tripartite-type tricarboxylate transporter receptor subunit TctC
MTKISQKFTQLMRSTAIVSVLSAAALIAISGTAQAQTYPDKPIKWVVGYPAGGGSDFLARTVSAQMSAQMGQPVIIDNRPGAGASIAADSVAKSAADGYTLLSADNGVLVYNPVLYKKLSYDPVRDFAPVGLMARVPLIIVAAPNAGIKNAKELLANLKSNPGKLSYASPGNGSPHHLAMELFKSRSGTFVVHVPYRGAAPAVQDVMAGQVPLMMVDASVGMPHIKSGKLIPLAVMSAKRIAQLPELPTVKELGFKDVEAYAWQGMVVPKNTPSDIQAKLSTEMQAAIANPAVRKKLVDAGWEPVPSDGNLLSGYIAIENLVWRKLIKERGITLD